MGLLNSKSAKRTTTSQAKEPNISEESTEKEVKLKSVLVLNRMGSQFFDEDGFLAHEFYEEVRLPDGHVKMQRVTTNLRPQGLVPFEQPRLHPDYPYVLV